MNCDYRQQPPRWATTASLHIPGNAASWRQQNTPERRKHKQRKLVWEPSPMFTVPLSAFHPPPPLRFRSGGGISACGAEGCCWCHRSVYRGLSHQLERLFGQCRCQTRRSSGITIQLCCCRTPSGSIIATVQVKNQTCLFLEGNCEKPKEEFQPYLTWCFAISEKGLHLFHRGTEWHARD